MPDFIPSQGPLATASGENGEPLLFEPERYYGPEELEPLGTTQTLANWRCFGKGPAYIKIGRKVRYRGCDLNAFIEASRVAPAA